MAGMGQKYAFRRSGGKPTLSGDIPCQRNPPSRECIWPHKANSLCVMKSDFHGAKAAVFLGDHLLIYQRDRHVIWPSHWDFPGGGREGDETPFQCLQRELREEFALESSPSHIQWQRTFPSMVDPAATAEFFVLGLPAEAKAGIRFGDEGQRWALLLPSDVAQLPDLVPELLDRLKLWLRETGRDPIQKSIK